MNLLWQRASIYQAIKKTYTFRLKTSHWSDGSPLIAEDIVNTWLDMLTPEFPCPNAHLLYVIKNGEKAKKGEVPLSEVGIEAPDQQTLIIHLEEPIPYFLEIVSFCVLSPVKQSLVKANSAWAEDVGAAFLCNGPFKPVSWIRNRQLILEKNPYYWDSKNVKLPGIDFSFVKDEITALGMYKMNELDLIGLPFTPIPADAVFELENEENIGVISCPASTLISFNMESFPFHNLSLRRAFALALNRGEIIDNITLLQEDSGINLLPPALRKGLGEHSIPDDDIYTAQKFLKEGLEELNMTKEELSSSISLVYNNSILHTRIAQALQAQWKRALNIDVQLVKLDHKILMNKLVSRDYQIGQCIWYAQYQDPMNLFERFLSPENPKNYPGFQNAEYGELLHSAQKEVDPDKRLEYLDQALSILVDQLPFTTIYHWNTCYLKKERVQNLYTRPTGSFFLSEIEVTPSVKS